MPAIATPQEKPLNHLQERFWREYLVDFNGTRAAKRAGYAKKCAGSIGFKLLKDPRIARRIEEFQAQKLKEAEISIENVQERFRRMAYAEPVTLVVRDAETRRFRYKRPDELTDDERALVADITIKNVETKQLDDDGNPIIKQQFSYKVHNTKDALDSLARTLGMFRDKVEHEHTHRVKALFAFVAQRPEEGETVARLDAKHGRRRTLTIEGSVERGHTHTAAIAK